MLGIFLIKTTIHLYSIYLIWNSTRVMKRVAVSQGNPESTQNISSITIVGVLCFIGFAIHTLGYLSVTILSSLNFLDDDNVVTVRCLYRSAANVVLLVAYLILINIFWTYVLNINRALVKKESRPGKQSKKASN